MSDESLQRLRDAYQTPSPEELMRQRNEIIELLTSPQPPAWHVERVKARTAELRRRYRAAQADPQTARDYRDLATWMGFAPVCGRTDCARARRCASRWVDCLFAARETILSEGPKLVAAFEARAEKD